MIELKFLGSMTTLLAKEERSYYVTLELPGPLPSKEAIRWVQNSF